VTSPINPIDNVLWLTKQNLPTKTKDKLNKKQDKKNANFLNCAMDT